MTKGKTLKRKHRATFCHPMFSGGEKKSFLNFLLLSATVQSYFNQKSAENTPKQA